MEIKLNIGDCKKIADNIEKKYSEIEQCLARKMLAQEHVIAELKQENADLLGLVQGFYNRATENKFSDRLRERRNHERAATKAALLAAASAIDNNASKSVA